ncbi:hypothetical protein HDV05_002089 [Chytridiales sp. JEL 0842]|nr:hypothetical protein HDV05_002089 [Chytridiales sp. JEL 0842]
MSTTTTPPPPPPSPPPPTPAPIPVTVFTGFLGAGKTTIILSLLKRLPKSYNLVLLKNEFGDVKVDSELVSTTASSSSSSEGGAGGDGGASVRVTEMLNGCLCCVLVGQMKVALLEIQAPIAWQIRQLEPQGFHLDAIITVIDCINFRGYEDTSYTARLQAQYTDVILLNKHEHITERDLDLLLDHVYDLNPDTPKLKCENSKGVSPDLIFGIDSTLFRLQQEGQSNFEGGGHMKNDVDLLTVSIPKWFTLTKMGEGEERYKAVDVRLTVMGVDIYPYLGVFADGFGMQKEDLEYVKSTR